MLKRKLTMKVGPTKDRVYVPSSDPPFKYSNCTYESHISSVYGCMFNPFSDPEDGYQLATCGANQIHIYYLEADGDKLEPRLRLRDKNKKESYYALTWAIDDVRGLTVLIVGGVTGLMRVIDPATEQIVGYLRGHGDSVNEIRTFPENPMIVVSASKDKTARIWNVGLQHCLAIYGGGEGHADEIISCDLHVDQTYLVTASVDHSIKLWDCRPETAVAQRINDSLDRSKREEIITLPPIETHFPVADTNDIHTNYVDCVRFIGKFIMSKSCEHQMALWKFGTFETGPDGEGDMVTPESYVVDYASFDIPDSSVWFNKFDICSENKYLAVGNSQGTVQLLDLEKVTPSNNKMTYILDGPNTKICTRQMAFSPDGKILIAACEAGLISRYDKVEQGHSSSCIVKNVKEINI
ncbi:unnamed protein product [Bursaphelenchus okinawaensis]|uniref:WD_REPEATS_REGION domain-containing protein n=1 Tax=Bursaphelenchus okinawaensis TaxID=465554 RepID=A0A811KG80_9BILA|nr:unnamed protein product [Bursaphelenchus okinawaensis]CAG9101667.1 unnamed protein product [Bursaphelenchus okinawaensis]